MLKASYILPIKLSDQSSDELTAYLRWLRSQLEVIVVDGSEPDVFAANAAHWTFVTHLAPADDIEGANGKVRGVISGVRIASHDRLIIADDDIRYDAIGLRQVLAGLKRADVVRPQNYFQPLPWHAFWDSGRILLNRATDGDWPGTLAVRSGYLPTGYDGNCLFENLELVRTVRAAGGKELIARDIFVRRLPPPARHFISQRIRQAYDEFARPLRFALQLALLPVSISLALRRPTILVGALLGAIGLAEIGRRRENGAAVFPFWTTLAAPLWLAERMVCAWLALGSRVALGGVRYHGRTIARAASSQRELEARFSADPAEDIARATSRGRRAATDSAKEKSRPASTRSAQGTPAAGPASAATGRARAHPKQAAHPRGVASRDRSSA